MPLLEVGRHDVKVAATAIAMSPTGKAKVVIGFENQNGTIRADLYLTDAAWEYTAKSLAVCGWDPAERDCNFAELRQSPSPIAGNEVQIVVDDEEHDGKLYRKVKWINPPGGVIVDSLPGDAGDELCESLRRQFGGFGGGSRPKAVAAPSEPAEADNNDVPW